MKRVIYATQSVATAIKLAQLEAVKEWQLSIEDLPQVRGIDSLTWLNPQKTRCLVVVWLEILSSPVKYQVWLTKADDDRWQLVQILKLGETEMTTYRAFYTRLQVARKVKELIGAVGQKLAFEDLVKIASKAIGAEIEVHESLENFVRATTLEDHKYEHSWVGTNKTQQSGEWLVGNGLFGEDYLHEYSQNGEPSSPSERHSEPEFETANMQIALVTTVWNNNFNRQGSDLGTSTKLHIWIGGEPVVGDPVVAEIMKKMTMLGLVD